MTSTWVFSLLGTPRWLQWLSLAIGVAVIVTWLITTLGLLFFIAGVLWILVGVWLARRMAPQILAQVRGLAAGAAPVRSQPPAPAPVQTPLPAVLTPPTLAPAAALAQGQAAIERLHGIDAARGDLNAMLASLKGESASVRNGTLIVLEGPPGTGKMTVARNLAPMLYGAGHVRRPEPYVVEEDEALAIAPAQWFSAMSRMAAAATGCVLVFRRGAWLVDKPGAEAVGRALSAAVDKQPGITVIITAPSGTGDRLGMGALRTAWLGRFIRHTVRFPELGKEAVAAILADLARGHELRFDEGADRKLAAALAALSSKEGYENAVTIHALFDDARAQAAKRAAALGNPATVITARDAEDAIELFHLSP